MILFFGFSVLILTTALSWGDLHGESDGEAGKGASYNSLTRSIVDYIGVLLIYLLDDIYEDLYLS